MLQLTKLRKERRFNKEIGGIVNVLKGVASSEFYRLQKARKSLDQFGEYLKDFIQMVDITGLHHPFIETSPLPSAILLITSDTGFLGKLNISIVNSALDQCSGDEKLIIVGKQGARLMEETGPVGEGFSGKDSAYSNDSLLSRATLLPGISDEVNYEEAEKLGDFIIRSFLDKKIGKITIVSPHFVSFAVWEVQVYQLLPCRFLFPETSRRAGDFEPEEGAIVEPSLSSITEYLVEVWIKHMLYGIFWESKLSEWAARVMHLEGSSNEIKEMDKKLRLKYFHALHEISDKNIREIFSSRSVMSHET